MSLGHGGYYIHELVSFWYMLLARVEEQQESRCGTSSAILYEGTAPRG